GSLAASRCDASLHAIAIQLQLMNPLGTVRSFCHLQRQLRWHKFGQRFFGRVLQFAGERSTWGCGGAASVLAMVRRCGYCFLLRWRRRFLLFLLLLAALRAPDVILIF